MQKKSKRINKVIRRIIAEGKGPKQSLTKTPYHLLNPDAGHSIVNVPDVTPYKQSDSVITIKDFSSKYEIASGNELLEKLKKMGFRVMTQLDYMSKNMMDEFCKSIGYEGFSDFNSQRVVAGGGKLELAAEAEQLKLTPGSLYTELYCEKIKFKVNSLKFPVKIIYFINLIGTNKSLGLKLLRESTHRNLDFYTDELTRQEADLVLLRMRKLAWRYGKYIPDDFLPFLPIIKEENRAKDAQQFIEEAKATEGSRAQLHQKFEKMSLSELGKLYNGRNNELEDEVNDIIKNIINERLHSQKD